MRTLFALFFSCALSAANPLIVISGGPPVVGGGAIAYIAGTGSGTDQNGSTTSAIDTTGATLLVAHVSNDIGHGGPITVSDSKGNTWTTLTTQTQDSVESTLYYTVPSSVGSGHTFTVAGSNCFASICVQSFSGTNASPFDQENGAGVSSAEALNAGSVTPSVANSVIVTGLANQDDISTPAVSGYTITTEVPRSGGNYYGSTMAYLIQGAASATNPAWTWSGSSNTAARSATFKP